MTAVPEDLGTPGSYISLEQGTRVFSSDGDEVGRVEEVRADAGADVCDGLVITTGMLGREPRFVEAAHVDEIYERGVVLRLDAAEARAIPHREDAGGR